MRLTFISNGFENTLLSKNLINHSLWLILFPHYFIATFLFKSEEIMWKHWAVFAILDAISSDVGLGAPLAGTD